MRTPSTRIRRIALNGAGPLAVLLAGTMVWQGSHAAFTAETFNAGNNWTSGHVELTNDGGSAMFTETELVPGRFGSKCIVVSGTATVTGTVKMYFDNAAAHGLEENLKMRVEQGTGGTFDSCVGFEASAAYPAELPQPLATFFAQNSTYATAILPWTKEPGVHSMTYKFSWVFDTTGLTQAESDALQGKSVRTDIEWELQNN